MTKHQKPVARLVPQRRPASIEVRDAVHELARLRNEIAHRRGARPILDKDIRQAIRQGPPLSSPPPGYISSLPSSIMSLILNVTVR